MTTASHARGISGPVSATAELARRVPALYTGSLKDVLDRRGHVQQTLPPERLPLGRGTRLASRRSCAGAVIDGARDAEYILGENSRSSRTTSRRRTASHAGSC